MLPLDMARASAAIAILCAPIVMMAHASAAPSSAIVDPEAGSIENGAYVNPYFGLSFPLPPNWSPGLPGPKPSESGYYVLASFDAKGGTAGTVLIAAQDEFFAVKPFDDAMAMVRDLRRSVSEIDGITIDQEPSAKHLANRSFAQLEFSGAGLHHVVLATAMRCHILSFTMTTPDAAMRDAFLHVMEGVDLAPEGSASSDAAPRCVRDYARDENVRRKIEPAPAGPVFTSVPVRLVLAPNGLVMHIHVIHGSAEQRHSLEAALSQWEFRPYEVDGHEVAVETGRVFRFSPENGAVDRRHP